MGECNHKDQAKAICIYEDCDAKDLLMCPLCMLHKHKHSVITCVRVDFAKDQMAPFI